MAQLRGGTRIYGSATVDSTLNIAGVTTAFRYESAAINNTNFVAGYRSGFTAANSSNNVLIGYEAGYDLDTSNANVAIGYRALYSTSNFAANSNVAIGLQAMENATQADECVCIGYLSGRSLTTGTRNIFLGYSAGQNSTTGQNNIALGSFANGSGAFTGSANIAIGNEVGYNQSSGSNCILIGNQAGAANASSGSDNIYMGLYAGRFNTSGSTNIAIGKEAMSYNAITGTGYNIALGSLAYASATSGVYNVAIGYRALNSTTTGQYNTVIGSFAGDIYGTNSSENTLIGYGAGYNPSANLTGNTFVGFYAGLTAPATYSTFLGNSAGRLANGSSNIAIGYNSFYSHDGSGQDNIAIGREALYNDGANSDYNIGLGYRALYGSATTTGDYNQAYGYQSGFTITSGSGNLLLGNYSGDSITTGSNNVVIVGGSSAAIDVPDPTGSGQLVIGSGTEAWIYGTGGYQVGIGTHVTTAKLTVAGQIAANGFLGDGSGLTNINVVGSGVTVNDDNVLRGTASTINFGDNLTVSTIHAGIVTVTATGGGGGGSTVGIATTGLSFFNDITSTGVITARSFNNHEVQTGTTNVVQSVITLDLRTNAHPNGVRWDTYNPGQTSAVIYCDDVLNNTINRELLTRISMGHMSPNTSTSGNEIYRQIMTPVGNAIGFTGEHDLYNNNYNWAPIISQVIPIRNTSSSGVSVTVNYARSSQYGDYNGSIMMWFEPNTTRYSTVSSVTHNTLNTLGRYAVDSYNTTGSSAFTVPANKTILLVQISTSRVYTTYSGYNRNLFTSVDTLFTNSAIQCDLRMVRTLANANWYQMGWTSTTADLYKVWNICATLEGDR